jgi:hypothetical protein
LIYYSKAADIREERSKALLGMNGCKQESAEELLDKQRPYGLFLRGFETELTRMVVDDRGGEGKEIDSFDVRVSVHPIEAIVKQYLEKDFAFIALADPRYDQPVPGVHRFFKKPDNWQALVATLLPSAKFIIIYLTHLTAGIVIELELLSNPIIARKSIIMTSDLFLFNDGSRWDELMKKFKFPNVVSTSEVFYSHASAKVYQQ